MNFDWSSSTARRTLGTSRLMRSSSARTACGHLHGVLARLFLHAHPDAGAAVDAGHRAAILGRVGDFGDVLQVHRDAGARHDDEVLDVVQAGELAGAAQQEAAVGVFDFAERDVLVLGAQDLGDAIDRQVHRGDLLARQIDVNLAAEAAVDGDRGDALDALEARRQVVLRQLAQRHRVVVALDAHAHDRHRVRVELEHRRRVGVFRHAAAHPIDARADFVGRFVEVGAPRELQPDVAAAFGRRGVDLLESGDRRDRLFDAAA